MKFFVAIALFAAVASARILPANVNLTPNELAEVEEIMAAIHSPSTDPTTAIMLEQMLLDLLGLSPAKPPITLPAIVDQYEPIHVGPALIDFPLPEGAVDPTPIPEAPAAPAAPAPPAATNPLVQIIVNVNQDSPASASPVQVDHVEGPSPVVVVEKPEQSEIMPSPVHVEDVAGPSIIKPSPVIIVDEPLEVAPEPILIGNLPETVAVAPIIVAPAVVGPETLN